METMLRGLGKLVTKTKTQSFADYPLNESNRDKLCAALIEFNLPITAVWIVARPVNHDSNSTFQHWSVKIQAPPVLLSLDFMEHKGKAAFKIRQSYSDDSGLRDFLYYKPKAHKQVYRLRIVTAVTPVPVRKGVKLNDYSKETLQQYMRCCEEDEVKVLSDKQVLLKPSNIRKRVCDIADFIVMWSDDAKYNVINCNCQHFAVDLLSFLVGNTHPDAVKLAIALMDEGCDVQKYKRKVTGSKSWPLK